MERLQTLSYTHNRLGLVVPSMHSGYLSVEITDFQREVTTTGILSVSCSQD